MPGVAVGREGWLFLSGGSNNADQLYKYPIRFTADMRQAWQQTLARRQQVAGQIGAAYAHVIAPEKISIYPEFFPEPLPAFGHHPCGYLGGLDDGQSRNVLVNPSLAFLQERLHHDLYCRRDSHWNLRGAALVVNLVMARLGYEQRMRVEALTVQNLSVIGDLARKLDTQPREDRTVALLPPHLRCVHRNEIVRYNDRNHGKKPSIHVGSSVRFVNDSPDAIGRSVLIFGDSYSDYHAGGLTHLFAELFAEVQFVWSQNIDIGMIQRIKPDILLTEGAERFMLRVPTDRFDLAAEVESRLAELSDGAPATDAPAVPQSHGMPASPPGSTTPATQERRPAP